ncbi:MAG: hypothetical protein CMH61_01400 [Nanoarchaeota archaeon]|nr:hypothetical protein [Nanoarchaeota archaeon]
MNKINLMNYVGENWRVILNDNFRQKLKRKIKEQKLKIKAISLSTGISIDSIWKLQEGRTNATFGYLKILCKKLNIREEELYQNIEAIYAGVKKAAFTLKSITVDEEFAAWWGAWIGEGDHSPTHESISMTNYEVNLLELHLKMLRKFKFPIDKPLVEVITNKPGEKDIIRKRWSKILNLPRKQITSITYMERASQEGARVQVWSAGLFRILHAIDDRVKSIISKSSLKVKIAYLRGIYAAEGSVRKVHIRIGMNDIKEITFIRKILLHIGIKTKQPNFNKWSGSHELSIYGHDNIEIFVQVGGFDLHKKRKQRLETMFSQYGKFPYHVSFRKIKKILEQQNVITNKEISQMLNTGHQNAMSLTRIFVEEGKLIVDRSEKELKYSLAT